MLYSDDFLIIGSHHLLPVDYSLSDPPTGLCVHCLIGHILPVHVLLSSYSNREVSVFTAPQNVVCVAPSAPLVLHGSTSRYDTWTQLRFPAGPLTYRSIQWTFDLLIKSCFPKLLLLKPHLSLGTTGRPERPVTLHLSSRAIP